jgi:hypothetical protein
MAAILVHLSVAAADEPSRFRGVEVGLRSGFAVPFGKAFGSASDSGITIEGGSLSDTLSGNVPIWLDLGYRLNERIYLGGYVSYAFGVLPRNVCERTECSASLLRFGLAVQNHFAPQQSFDPWVGAGVGYEALATSQKRDVVTESIRLAGFDAHIQSGLDYKVSPQFGIGPIVTASIGQYTSGSSETTSSTVNLSGVTQDFPKAFHGWLTFGLRGAFDFFSGPSGVPHTEPDRATDRVVKPEPHAEKVVTEVLTPTPVAEPVPEPAHGVTSPPVGTRRRNRGSCNYICINDRLSVDSADFERAVSAQLSALRQCSLQSSEKRTITTYATFGPNGQMKFGVDSEGMSEPMQACIATIPLSASFTGPPNQRWKCSDYCQ